MLFHAFVWGLCQDNQYYVSVRYHLPLSNACKRWSFIWCFQTYLVFWDLIKISNRWAAISLGKSFRSPGFKLSILLPLKHASFVGCLILSNSLFWILFFPLWNKKKGLILLRWLKHNMVKQKTDIPLIFLCFHYCY